jgi:hypothetical protein
VPGRLITWSITEWVAVMVVAPGSEELVEAVERVVEVCPDDVVLARVHPHDGLANALGVDPGWWFCGVAASDRERLEESEPRLRAAIGRPPLVVGAFRLLRLVD